MVQVHELAQPNTHATTCTRETDAEALILSQGQVADLRRQFDDKTEGNYTDFSIKIKNGQAD